ncbi:IS1096 element passenger TnpR family protein [Gordonia polyisoprenivorans]
MGRQSIDKSARRARRKARRGTAGRAQNMRRHNHIPTPLSSRHLDEDRFLAWDADSEGDLYPDDGEYLDDEYPVLTLRVELVENSRVVRWRRVVMPGEVLLSELAECIQLIFDGRPVADFEFADGTRRYRRYDIPSEFVEQTARNVHPAQIFDIGWILKPPGTQLHYVHATPGEREQGSAARTFTITTEGVEWCTGESELIDIAAGGPDHCDPDVEYGRLLELLDEFG